MTGEAAVAAEGLVKTRRGRRVLDGCTFEIPAGAVCGVLGRNGAGKTTLLRVLAGLTAPTEGRVLVRGEPPLARTPGPAHLGQDKPLPGGLTAEEILRTGRALNPDWDEATARRVLAAGDLPEGVRVGRMSGGQRSLVALALALGRRTGVALLDEPFADLDPLVRHRVSGLLMAEVADGDLTVLVSTHVFADLAGFCDHLLLLARGRVALAGAVADIEADHLRMVGVADDDPGHLEGHTVVSDSRTGRQVSALVKTDGPAPPQGWTPLPASLEEITLAYLAGAGNRRERR